MIPGADDAHTRETPEGAHSVSDNLYWRYDRPPRGVKVFLLNEGGVAVAPGPWVEGQGLIAWHPLFKRDHGREGSKK